MLRSWLPISLIAAALTCGASAAAPDATSSIDTSSTQTQQVSAGPINVSLSVDRSTISVAQSVVAVLRVVAPTGVQIELPPSAPKLGEWTIQSVVDEPRVVESDSTGLRSVLVRRYVLEPFLAGEYTIPPIDIRWRRVETAESGVARTAPVKITVQSLLPPPKAGAETAISLDPGTIRDAYIPRIASDWSSLWIGIGLGIGVSMLAAGGIWFARRTHASRDTVEAGLAAVRQQRNNQFDASGLQHACDVLSNSLRRSLADRVDPASLTSTPNALKARLADKTTLPPQTGDEIVNVLDRLDAVRFSGEPVARSDFDQLADRTLALLTGLKPLPRVSTTQEAAV